MHPRTVLYIGAGIVILLVIGGMVFEPEPAPADPDPRYPVEPPFAEPKPRPIEAADMSNP
ncbi:hypothetical protein C4552_04380 [Candidatus Parcubacteria bacterium]|nr:MAG: hypothetical protein C4552_04380 [Candidatus Parcubacteria bacterium]